MDCHKQINSEEYKRDTKWETTNKWIQQQTNNMDTTTTNKWIQQQTTWIQPGYNTKQMNTTTEYNNKQMEKQMENSNKADKYRCQQAKTNEVQQQQH